MGIVWAATHTVTRKKIALKFLKGPMHLRPELRKRFLREARAASAVIHPNVLEVHDVFELDDETPVMLMDLLEGETLGARIARLGKLSLSETADILIQVVSAHAVGVVHRDLKPDNIFLVGSPKAAPSVRVLDFGIAKLVGLEGPTAETGIITGTGSMVGTPCYMSPEQSYGEKAVDYRTDVWSLGVIFYECLTGARPVEGDSIGQVVKRLVSDGITPISVADRQHARA
jgi:serine/threonine-protein kinase